jgi:hypothetical protein
MIGVFMSAKQQIGLHLVCLMRTWRLRWHLAGIARAILGR